MKRDELRAWAHRAADWSADYVEGVGERRVLPDIAPGAVREQLPHAAPEAGEPFDEIFADFERLIVPAMTHWNHPGWFAYYPANNSPPSIVAEALTAAMGAQCMSWQTSPAATELEQVMMSWLGQMLGLPESFVGVIQDTASTAALVAMISARTRVAGHGPGVPADLTVYASQEAHVSVDKATRLAGIGGSNLRRVPVDPASFAMRADALRDAIAEDRQRGMRPTCVVATLGTTASSAVDPLAEIGPICAEAGVWLHVDAAYAGTAALLPERRWILDGVQHADSFNFNPHKWMLTNFDCSAYFVRDPAFLRGTFGANPEYLRGDHDGEVPNFRDWGIQLGRRFRALKLWFVLRSYGVEGLRRMLRDHIAWAAALRERIAGDPRLELVGDGHFGLVCFRVAGDDEAADAASEALLRRLNADGAVHLTHAELAGRFTLRAVVGQWQTSEADVRRLGDRILDGVGG